MSESLLFESIFCLSSDIDETKPGSAKYLAYNNRTVPKSNPKAKNIDPCFFRLQFQRKVEFKYLDS